MEKNRSSCKYSSLHNSQQKNNKFTSNLLLLCVHQEDKYVPYSIREKQGGTRMHSEKNIKRMQCNVATLIKIG